MKKYSGRKPGKRPVLTSPWKIGAFVALQLIFVGLSVGYFFVTVYRVRLDWLKIGSSGWGVDSYLFFRQMYPLVAAVLLVSLMSYFIVASAVRRYKFYLDSGMDYRKMISLAESIDDLTNPSQIARLSSYPELQAVLRSYGDSIREISQELGQKEERCDYGELDREIDVLLAGEPSDEAPTGKAWESAYRKIEERIESDRRRIEELERKGQADHAVISRAALAYGRVMEALGNAGGDLVEITRGLSELHRAADETDAPAAASADALSQRKALRAIVTEMESAVRKLEEGGHVLHEFSEENNGIALNMAIMAAKGSVGEQDLAGFADRVRHTAERFRRLNGTILSIAQGLLSNCYALKEKLVDGAPVEQGGSRSQRRIAETVRMIEERSNLLERRICALGSELHEVQEPLRQDFAGAEAPDARAPETAPRVAPPSGPERVRAFAGEQTAPEESGFVIDRGKAWEGLGAMEEEPADEAAADAVPRALGSDERPVEAAQGAGPEERPGEAPSTFSDMSSLRDLGGSEEMNAAPASKSGEPEEPGSWMEMPGHRWLKIDVDQSEAERGPDAVSVRIDTPAESSARGREPERPAAEEATFGAPAEESASADDGETIYDLLELGAVEYAEETPAQR